MKKLIIFDLDGVLVEAKTIHYDALNEALGEDYAIDWNEHLSKYDGLKTNQKLEMLTQDKGLPTTLYKQVWDEKQRLTLQKLKNLQPNTQLMVCMDLLVQQGYKLAVCNGMEENQMVVAQKSNMFFGTDLLSDATRITLMDMAALDGSDNMRLVARYSGGVQLGIGADIVHQS